MDALVFGDRYTTDSNDRNPDYLEDELDLEKYDFVISMGDVAEGAEIFQQEGAKRANEFYDILNEWSYDYNFHTIAVPGEEDTELHNAMMYNAPNRQKVHDGGKDVFNARKFDSESFTYIISKGIDQGIEPGAEIDLDDFNLQKEYDEDAVKSMLEDLLAPAGERSLQKYLPDNEESLEDVVKYATNQLNISRNNIGDFWHGVEKYRDRYEHQSMIMGIQHLDSNNFVYLSHDTPFNTDLESEGQHGSIAHKNVIRKHSPDLALSTHARTGAKDTIETVEGQTEAIDVGGQLVEIELDDGLANRNVLFSDKK